MEMLGNFRKTFRPTETEKKERHEKDLQTVARSIKEKACWLCIHFYIDDSIPAFVEYRGECDLDKKIDALRSMGEDCVSWELDESKYLVKEILESEFANEKGEKQHV